MFKVVTTKNTNVFIWSHSNWKLHELTAAFKKEKNPEQLSTDSK